MKRILIIEDDEQLSRLLELEMTHKGYNSDVVIDGYDGINKIHNNDYDLVLLDIMLPGIDGIEVCKRIRLFSEIPIIMLTAKDDIINKIIGLDSGADDYLTKPFISEELFARIRAVLRRNDQKDDIKDKICINNLVMDRKKREVTRNGKIIHLSKKEFDLLEYMLLNKNIVLTRENIINTVWGYEFMGDTNNLDVYIRYLRSKIDEPFEEKLIHTCRGIGYSIKENN